MTENYNRKKKPWRKLRWAHGYKKHSQNGLRKGLLFMAFLEAVLILPIYGKELALWSEKYFSVEKEAWSVSEEGHEDRKSGETRENGFSLNWKEGTVKLWQKVEQVVLQEPD
ncbi:MAG: hypothetical protein QM657_06635 [Lacrimispora sp.]|uniref:hypothetical protein n=1 Tax=Lacrimispora sp. TaxID=2719234 RepID=UPI0039E4303B